MALIVPGGYYSRVALDSRHFWDPSTSIIAIASLSPLPGKKRWHTLVPGAAYRQAKKKRRRVAHFGNLHQCSSHSRLVSGDLDT